MYVPSNAVLVSVEAEVPVKEIYQWVHPKRMRWGEAARVHRLVPRYSTVLVLIA